MWDPELQQRMKTRRDRKITDHLSIFLPRVIIFTLYISGTGSSMYA